ncbi:MAG TPA: hypothetical protein PLQ81_13840 [bacterium]|nr:hypothetical protein [bacterium]
MNVKNDYQLNEESYIEYMANLLENDKEKFIIEICRQLKKLHEDLNKGKCGDKEECYDRYIENKKRYRENVLNNVKKTDEYMSILAKWGGWIFAIGIFIYNFFK